VKLLAGPVRTGRVRPLLALTGIATIGLVLLLPEEPPMDGSALGSGGRAARVSAATDMTWDRGRIELPDRTREDREVRDVFPSQTWYVTPPPQPRRAVRKAPTEPVAPSLPFEFLGSYVEQNGAPVYFLVQGERVFDVRVGESIDGKYTVDGREGNSLLLTYLPLRQQQALSMEN